MEIQQCLVKHGATKITIDFSGQLPVAITFCLKLHDNVIGFSLPSNHDGVLKAMESDKNISKKYLNEEQALKVSWRIIKTWVDAQMAIVEAQLADMAEVFLPYAVTKSGSTLYKELKYKEILMLQEG